MVATVSSPKVTPEEFLRMGSNARGFELIDGELVETLMSMESSRISGEILYHIRAYLGQRPIGWLYPSDLGFQIFAKPGQIRKPDVAYISFERLPIDQYEDEGLCSTPPNLVVEVISPNDLAYDVNKKTDEWLNAGVDTVWNVYPDNHTVRIHRKDEDITLREGNTIANEPAMPGFTLKVADIFRKPGVTVND